MQVLDTIKLKSISNITHKLILLLMAVDVISILTLPWLLGRILLIDLGRGYESITADRALYIYFLAVLYIVAILGLLILNNLRLLFKTCLLEEVFIKENVSRLFRMAIEAGGVTFIFLTKMFVVNSIMTMVVVFAFFMASVFCLVLTLLFDQAVHYKLENDLTI